MKTLFSYFFRSIFMRASRLLFLRQVFTAYISENNLLFKIPLEFCKIDSGRRFLIEKT